MGKRSAFARRPQDAYDTPPEAVPPLLDHLPPYFTYTEPCAGCGALMDALSMGGCDWAGDISPRRDDIAQVDALKTTIFTGDYIITNPPWTREILHPMIDHFYRFKPTWLLFDADWAHTVQAIPYMDKCRKIVSVGRLRWIPGSPYSGKDNVAWYLFAPGKGTNFYGRKKRERSHAP